MVPKSSKSTPWGPISSHFSVHGKLVTGRSVYSVTCRGSQLQIIKYAYGATPPPLYPCDWLAVVGPSVDGQKIEPLAPGRLRPCVQKQYRRNDN